MMRLQLLSILADVLVFFDLARGLELIAPAPDRPLVDTENPGDLVVVELWYLQQLGQNGPVVVGELFACHGRALAMVLAVAEWFPEVRAQSGASAQAAEHRERRNLPKVLKSVGRMGNGRWEMEG
jgi:hypothetical protein